jgi:O-antigen/teichoic acid export membrane protein
LVVLGRLLGPEPYGLIAMALIVIAFGELFVIDSGFGDAIIQRKELSDDHCDAAFWLLLGSSLIAMTIFMLGSPLVAASFDQPRVAGLISALSLTLPLGALSAVPNALLSRELRFRALAARDSFRALVAVPLRSAWRWRDGGSGVWWDSIWFKGRWPWSSFGRLIAGARGSASHSCARELLSFSMAMFGIRTLQFAQTAMMRGLLGYFFGPVVLGYFFMARRVTHLMHELLTAPTSRVALPTFAQVQADRERARRLLRSGMRMLSLVAVPGYAGLIVVAPVGLPLVLSRAGEALSSTSYHKSVIREARCLGWTSALRHWKGTASWL